MPWPNIFRKRAEDMTFGLLNASQVPDGKQPELIEADKAYLKIILRSMRIVDVRKGLKKFFGAVHSFISIPHIEKRAQFHVLTVPSDLKDIDAINVDRILQFNKYLVDSVPYRGGGVEIELGLFSIQSVNLADSILKILEGMADAAGVSLVEKAIPFVKPLSEGINLLLGTQNNRILEVGLDTTLDKPSTGYFVIMSAPQGQIELSSLKLDEAYRLIDQDGQPIANYPYMVYSIEAPEERETWFEIPEIAMAWREVREAAREGDIDKTQEAFIAFKRIVLTSSDLLDQDADNLVQKAQEKLNKLFSNRRARAQKIELDSLDKIRLYSR